METEHTPPPKILIAGSFDALAELLMREGYSVEVTPMLNYTLAQQAASFDLLLVDEDATQLWARESALHSKVVVVFDREPTQASVRIAMEAGAKSCVYKLWDKERIIAELVKVLRYSGFVTNGARVLIVDNTAVKDPLKQSLTDLGYQVRTASDYDAALADIDKYEPHVVITDIALDSDYANDDTGFRLAEEIRGLYANTVKVVLRSRAGARVPIGQTLKGRKVALKGPDGDVEALTDQITESIKELNLNLSLEVEFDPPSNSWKVLADIIQRKVDKPTELIEAGLKDIIGKLFHDNLKVKACHVMDSAGGNGALLISPVQQKATRDYFLVRVGERAAIQAETDTFKVLVAPHLKGPIVDLLSEVRTMRLGGLKFSFSRGFDGYPRDFATFYRDTTENGVCAAIERLTSMLSEPQYQQRIHEGSDEQSLIKSYKETLNDSFHFGVLESEVEKLLSEEDNSPVRFRKRRSGIEVTIEANSYLYPNALEFFKNLGPESVPVPRAWGVTNAGFTARNLFIDAADNIWLTDFHATQPGPILRDFSHLEAIVKFELIQHENFADLFDFEQSLLSPERFTDVIRLSPDIERNPEFAKARTLITKIRTLAQQQYRQNTLTELYVCLLCRTLKMMTWKGITSEEKDRDHFRLRYAYLSSLMIAHRLQKDFDGWGKKTSV